MVLRRSWNVNTLDYFAAGIPNGHSSTCGPFFLYLNSPVQVRTHLSHPCPVCVNFLHALLLSHLRQFPFSFTYIQFQFVPNSHELLHPPFPACIHSPTVTPFLPQLVSLSHLPSSSFLRLSTGCRPRDNCERRLTLVVSNEHASNAWKIPSTRFICRQNRLDLHYIFLTPINSPVQNTIESTESD